MKRYDVITGISGESIADGDGLVHAIASKTPGSTVSLMLLRDGREMALSARLEERSDDQPADDGTEGGKPSARPATPRGDAIGIVPTELTRKMRRDYQIPSDRLGVVVDEIVGLAPGLDDLAHGDVIVEVNRRPTPDLAAYKKAIASLKAGDAAWLYVYRPRPRSTFLVKAEVGSPS